MKKTITLLGISAVSLLSADCQNGNCGYYYQNQPSSGYYQESRDQYYRRGSEQPYYQDQRSQGYYDNRASQNYDRRYDNRQDQGYYNEKQGQMSNDTRQDQDYYDKNNQKNVSDQELQKKVRDSLSSWFSNDYKNVSADVNNGNVTLRGSVNTNDDRKKIEDKIRKIDGVRQINNQITVAESKTAWNDSYNYADNDSKMRENEQKYPNDYAATDADRMLNSKIRDKISNTWFGGYDTIILKTTNGVVIITGKVDSFDDIKKINEKIKGVDGVKTVNNQVTARKS